ncbi:hypothetical protein FBUS_04703 [Fasciolopsis buskii]|uniref:Uncharacterized protein n=1 Tax=Fasciolopsis buskii TaxID=27845 RepID=A0A8E0VNF5_9TREM|nr:hypothetical protein FBUS_04703 [Fasciolopsis buski]
MFTLHHQLLLVKKDDNGDSRFTQVHGYSILVYQDNEDRGESLEQTEVRLFCVVRPPHLGSYRLEVYAKTFELVDHYKPARPFPTSLSHVWGCYPARFPDPEKKQMVINSRYRANIQTAVVENPRKGMVGLQQIRLPVLYDLVVKRSKQTVQIKIKHRQTQTMTETAEEVEPDDPFFVMDEEENEPYITFTLRFTEFGEHAVDVYADSGQRQGKRRLYEMIGQFLFDIHPRDNNTGNWRTLNDVLNEAKSLADCSLATGTRCSKIVPM